MLRALLVISLFTLGCSDSASSGDAGTAFDAGSDGSTPDAGSSQIDAGLPTADGGASAVDAGVDAGGGDAGATDAGATDAGATDAGRPDAGPLSLDDRYVLHAQHPEGGVFDFAGERFFVGSLVDGSIHALDARTGDETVFFTPTELGTWWTLGMDIDESRNLLMVCAMEDRREIDDVDPPYEGWVWELDLDTGERVTRHELGAAFDTATCTDVIVASDGTTYVTDREHPNLYRIPAGAGPELLVTDDALAASVVGLNAIVLLPDESALLAAVYLPSRLVRVTLPDLQVRDVDIDGDFFNATPPLSGADGMALLAADHLLVQFTGELAQLRSDDGGRSATSETIDVPAIQTDVIHTPDGDYMLAGQAREFGLGLSTEPFALQRVDYRAFD